MANIKHGTLTTTAVSTVTLGRGATSILVINRDATTNELWVTAARGSTPADPVVDADDNDMIPAQSAIEIAVPQDAGPINAAQTTVKLKGNRQKYTIKVLS